MEITTRTDLFLANAPLHGISRIAYSNNVSVNPGAWILVTQSLTADEAQRINQPALSDGAQPLTPMECVVKPGAFAGQRRRAPVFACAPYYSDEALTQELHWLPLRCANYNYQMRTMGSRLGLSRRSANFL